MRILPDQTSLARAPYRRRHRPELQARPYGYRRFRPCLRWDFGFTCAFCLLHERDIMAFGVEGWGVVQTDHFEPKSLEPDRSGDYENCYLCCSRCNLAHADQPVEVAQCRLLEPCGTAWAERFRVTEDFRLMPKDETDRDAERTEQVFDLNDPHKVMLRRKRSEAIKEAWQTLRKAKRLLDDYPDLTEPLRDFVMDSCESARTVLATWNAIPSDAPEGCGCEAENFLSLPSWLEEQCEELPSCATPNPYR